MAGFRQGLPVGAIAEVRHIQVDSVEGYLAEAITAGAAYDWQRLRVSRDALASVAVAAASAWKLAHSSASCVTAATGPPGDGSGSSGADGEVLSVEVEGTEQGGRTGTAPGGQEEAAALSCADGEDLTHKLQAAGVSVKVLKERLPESVRYGQIRLGLAHIGRLGLLRELLAG